MAKKKSNNEGEKNNNGGKENGGKKDNSATVVVLKIDLHCEGCESKIIKSIRGLDGVESVSVGDKSKVTVVGKVDPSKLREMVEKKSNKKVELVSPLPKKGNDKEKENEKENVKNKGGDGEEKKKKAEEKSEKQPNEKKPKEPPVITVVLKVHLHCEGCIHKIQKVVTKTKGYLEMKIEREKDLVTVKGTMDAKVLAESLTEKLRKPVEIVPPKKEGGGEKGKGGGKGGGGDGGSKADGDGSGKATGGGGGGGGGVGGGAGYTVEGVNRMEYGFQYPYPAVYGSGYYVDQVHAPQMFSDENPNACAVM